MSAPVPSRPTAPVGSDTLSTNKLYNNRIVIPNPTTLLLGKNIPSVLSSNASVVPRPKPVSPPLPSACATPFVLSSVGLNEPNTGDSPTQVSPSSVLPPSPLSV